MSVSVVCVNSDDNMECSEQQIIQLSREEGGGGVDSGQPTAFLLENEKRIRREIANSNERRRMQSINAGFQSLRSLLPHHEGEKLSKAAILQQTTQYIIDLEREKTNLLSQNCQLKRLVDQHDGGEVFALKKRKLDVLTIQTDSSDEGLGSMSPEPVTLLSSTNKGSISVSGATVAKEVLELKTLLEKERRQNLLLEERLRQIECQVFPNERYQEVIEHTDNIIQEDDLDEDDVEVSIIQEPMNNRHNMDSCEMIIGGPQVVICSSADDDLVDEDSRTNTPCEMICKEEIEITEQPPPPPPPQRVTVRLQPILEAAIKAEPKVEVERINSVPVKVIGGNNTNKTAPTTRMYTVQNTSRQNLETIVEAIRHLEGDQLFGEPAQDIPLALTNKQQTVRGAVQHRLPNPVVIKQQPGQVAGTQQRHFQIDMSKYLQFRTTGTETITPTAKVVTTSATVTTMATTAKQQQLQQHQQCRPGVIVVKQQS